jgi:dolichol-phosphate mannosyltransferase
VRGIRKHAGDWSVLFIDDASPDGTADEVRALSQEDPGVRLLERPAKEGLGHAYRAAYRRVLEEGGCDRVFMMDADLSHRPVHLPALDTMLESRQMAIGSRYLRGVSVLNWSILRLNLSWAANLYIRALTGMPFTDCTSGFRAFRPEVLPVLLSAGIRAAGYAFLVETLHSVWLAGLPVGEVPIVFEERCAGSSKVDGGVFMESLLTPPRLLLRGRKPPGGQREE